MVFSPLLCSFYMKQSEELQYFSIIWDICFHVRSILWLKYYYQFTVTSPGVFMLSWCASGFAILGIPLVSLPILESQGSGWLRSKGLFGAVTTPGLLHMFSKAGRWFNLRTPTYLIAILSLLTLAIIFVTLSYPVFYCLYDFVFTLLLSQPYRLFRVIELLHFRVVPFQRSRWFNDLNWLCLHTVIRVVSIFCMQF